MNHFIEVKDSVGNIYTINSNHVVYIKPHPSNKGYSVVVLATGSSLTIHQEYSLLVTQWKESLANTN